jgi:hypothetical protein
MLKSNDNELSGRGITNNKTQKRQRWNSVEIYRAKPIKTQKYIYCRNYLQIDEIINRCNK